MSIMLSKRGVTLEMNKKSPPEPVITRITSLETNSTRLFSRWSEMGTTKHSAQLNNSSTSHILALLQINNNIKTIVSQFSMSMMEQINVLNHQSFRVL